MRKQDFDFPLPSPWKCINWEQNFDVYHFWGPNVYFWFQLVLNFPGGYRNVFDG